MKYGRSVIGAAAAILLLFATSFSQSTEFTYQGSLKDGGNPANGSYDLEFALFDAVAGGVQLGSAVSRPGVNVSNGVFSVSLDFGNQFPGSARYLEIRVRPAGGGTFTTLSPRQSVSSIPYSVKTLSADNATNATNSVNATNATTAGTANNSLALGGLAAGQYVLTGDARLSDPRTPTPGSSSYIQNGTAQQAASNFNISGNGTVGGTLTANTLSSATQYNLGNFRLLGTSGCTIPCGYPWSNTFAGVFAGQNTAPTNTLGHSNSFFGNFAGNQNTTGQRNAFFGFSAGYGNTTGLQNSYFGELTGQQLNGSMNSFFGNQVATFGSGNGSRNAAFGAASAQSITSGSENAFLGYYSGRNTSTGSLNTFVGSGSGLTNTTGSSNTTIGYGSDLQAASLTNATAIGANARVDVNNALVLGGVSGINGGTSVNVGIGTTAPAAALDVVGGADPIRWARSGAGKTWAWEVDGSGTYVRNATDATLPLSIANGGNVGIGTTAPISRLQVVGAGGDVQGVQIDNREIKFRGDGFGHFSIFANRILRTLTIEDTSSNSATNTPGAPLMAITRDGNVGIGTTGPGYKLHVNGETRTNTLSIDNYVANNGGPALCANTSNNRIALCTSSLRYKTNVKPFTSGLALVKGLRPISFDWKEGGLHDFGLGAEDVAQAAPDLVFKSNGRVEGVKYDHLSVVLVNAIKEQQYQIEGQNRSLKRQQIELKTQQAEIEALKALVCIKNRRASICSPKR